MSTDDPIEIWRVGRKLGRTIYAQSEYDPGDDDDLIGIMDTPELAAQVVRAVNASGAGGRWRPGRIRSTGPAAPAGIEPGEWHVIVHPDGTTSWAPILPDHAEEAHDA